MERHSSMLRGILITSFFAVFAIGVGAGLGLSLMMTDGPEDVAVLMPKTSPTNGDVPVDQDCEFGPFETAEGSLELYDYNIPAVMPLCITPTVVEDWYVIVKSVGGYHPSDCYGDQTFDIIQKGDEITCGNTYIGYGIIWTDVTEQYWDCDPCDPCDDCCACTRFYKGVPDTSCDNVGCIDSMWYPEVGCDCTIDWAAYNPEGCSIPDKEVYIEISTTWAGCDNFNQHFDIILVHKNHIIESPTLNGF